MLKYIMCLCLAVCGFSPAFSADKGTDMFIVTESDKDSYYSNETGKLILWLYTQNPEISGVNELAPVSISNGEFSYISRISTSEPFRKVKYKGKEYFAAPVAAYAFMIKDAGKYSISGGEYQIGTNIPTVVHDPIFGNIRTYRTSVETVTADKTSIKVKRLPSNDNAESFSGAVGSYKVDVIIPQKEIIINEPSTIIIKIEGAGLIGDDTLPDYRSAFSENVKLKSMNEKNDYYYDGKNVISRKILECEVIPTERENCTIGSVEFGYFNPDSGKYEVAASVPIVLDVKSSTVKIAPFSV